MYGRVGCHNGPWFGRRKYSALLGFSPFTCITDASRLIYYIIITTAAAVITIIIIVIVIVIIIIIICKGII